MSINRREIRRSMGSRSSRRSSLKAFLRGRAKTGTARMERPRVILARKIRAAKPVPAPAVETMSTFDEVMARKLATLKVAQK